MIGRRVMPETDGHLPRLEPGDFGYAPATRINAHGPKFWEICTPNGHCAGIRVEERVCVENEDGSKSEVVRPGHVVTVHSDENITVTPELRISDGVKDVWVGTLTCGVWDET